MLYVVVREIEAERLERTVTADRAEAEACYADAFRVCENGPDEGPGEDLDIVSNCWLYAASTCDAALADLMTVDGRAKLLKTFTDEY